MFLLFMARLKTHKEDRAAVVLADNLRGDSLAENPSREQGSLLAKVRKGLSFQMQEKQKNCK